MLMNGQVKVSSAQDGENIVGGVKEYEKIGEVRIAAEEKNQYNTSGK